MKIYLYSFPIMLTIISGVAKYGFKNLKTTKVGQKIASSFIQTLDKSIMKNGTMPPARIKEITSAKRNQLEVLSY